MSGTNVPSPVFGPTGFIAPPESLILAGVQADINAAFGGNLSQDLETPQGQLASSLTAIIGDKNDQFLLYINGVDPAFSKGRMHDGLARIYFLARNPPLPTAVIATATGLPGVIIPMGSLARAVDGSIYQSTAPATIGPGGTVDIPFANLTVGPIPCPIGTLNQVYGGIPGWDRIGNAADGIIGQDVETDADLEQRRQETVQGNSFGAIGSIIGAVAKVAGVLDFYGYDNASGAPLTIGGVTIAAKSIYVCVAGGAPLDIAQAILSKKGGGCGYTGNTTVTAYDRNPLYSAPIPYTVKYQTPTPLDIFATVTIVAGPTVPANAVALVQGAFASAFSGNDGGPRARIGTTIFASRFYAAIASLGSWAQIASLFLGDITTPGSNFTASCSGPTLTVTAVAGGALAIGQIVAGAGFPAGCYIAGFGTGGGGAGTYLLSTSQTVASESGILGINTASTQLPVNINQAPNLNPASVVVLFQ